MRESGGFLVQTACLWEATARKVGNVHPGTGFADTAYTDFLLSAAAIARLWDRPRSFVGKVVIEAVKKTNRRVGKNTNLGIVLLLAPFDLCKTGREFRSSLRAVLANLDFDHDARWVYEAIRLANPGGLGNATEQDVHRDPTVTLLEAMKLAADRDLVARQYANGYADVFDFGVPAFLAGLQELGCVEAAIIDSQLRWLAKYPDSLIARKNGPAVAADVQRRAADILRVGGIATSEGCRAGVELDKHLRSDGNKLNPGTTADLITACLFVALRENKVLPSAPFHWDVPDWL
ncbi:MAG TPA: triphosphoribosyl-dephospho-CoA synthase [Gemmata sp.]|nr:triphosphoribosyl-dephospho-CoA synthase [Gemmata sp.]